MCLIIYNLPGNEVRDLFTGKKEPGFYELNFGGEKLPSDLYVYRIEAGDFISSKKMVLIKQLLSLRLPLLHKKGLVFSTRNTGSAAEIIFNHFSKEKFPMLKLILIFITIVISSGFLFSQDNNSNPCAPETSQFDFWLGKWKAEWENPDGSKSEGTNEINSILDGCVIQENFNGNPGMNFLGKSFSVYNSNKKIWQQTWVDNQGTYMDFTGGMQDDKMILSRKINFKEKEISQRMVFYNITEKKFDWDWETSLDGGKTWELKWRIHYSRI